MNNSKFISENWKLKLAPRPDAFTSSGESDGHSGYTPAQYRAAAAQVLLWQGRYGIPYSRLTTHAAVDRSRSRYDPRSFRWDRFEPAYRRAAQLCRFSRFDTGRASW